MTRTYGRINCWVCGQPHSTNGLATVNHMRKHVREGLVREIVPEDIYGDVYRYEQIKGAVLPLAQHPTPKVPVDQPALHKALQRKLTPAMADVLRKMRDGWKLYGGKSDGDRWMSKGDHRPHLNFDTVHGLAIRGLVENDDKYPIMTYRLTADGELTARGL